MRCDEIAVDGLEDRTDDAEIGGEKDAEIWRDEIWRDEDAEIWRDEDAEIRRDVCRPTSGFRPTHERFSDTEEAPRRRGSSACVARRRGGARESRRRRRG